MSKRFITAVSTALMVAVLGGIAHASYWNPADVTLRDGASDVLKSDGNPVYAGQKTESRRVKADYVGSMAAFGTECRIPLGCAVFKVKPGERFVELNIEDGTGAPVGAAVYTRGNYLLDHDHICGRTTEPLELQRGLRFLVVELEAPLGPLLGVNCAATPGSAGTITATFFRR